MSELATCTQRAIGATLADPMIRIDDVLVVEEGIEASKADNLFCPSPVDRLRSLEARDGPFSRNSRRCYRAEPAANAPGSSISGSGALSSSSA